MFSKDWLRSKLTFPFSRLIVANSHAGLNAFHASHRKSRVIYNGYDFGRNANLLDPSLLRVKYKLTGKIVITMIAGFYQRKDYETFCRTAEKLKSGHEDLVFMAIGDGYNQGYYKSKYGQLQNLLLTGKIEDVESYVNMCDIGVLLSNPKVHKEGISNSLMETMAFGKPVIATKGGGTNELIEDGVSGILIEPGSVADFENALFRILNDPDFARQLGDSAKIRIQEMFSIQKMVQSTIEIYSEVLNNLKEK